MMRDNDHSRGFAGKNFFSPTVFPLLMLFTQSFGGYGKAYFSSWEPESLFLRFTLQVGKTIELLLARQSLVSGEVMEQVSKVF